MKNVHINFFKTWDGHTGIDTDTREMRISALEIKTLAKKHGLSFFDAYTKIISHEIMHQVIYDNINDEASCDFDNICYRKYSNIKYWVGGVGGNNGKSK